MSKYVFVLRPLAVALLVMAALVAPLNAQVAPTPTGGQPWDLTFTTQAGEFAFYDAPAGASTTGKPVDVGDFDGDGCGDLAITGQNATHPVAGEWRGSVGHVRIVMNLCQISGQIGMDALTPMQRVITIYGAYAGDMAGTETYVADFNRDGFDDLLFSAQNSDGPYQDRSNAGAVYLLLGGSTFALLPDVDLRQPPSNLLTFYGATAEDRFGLWVEGGDFDGDGIKDMLIGANQADGEGDHRINAGEAWILYGDMNLTSKYRPVTDMQQPPADATRIIGANYDDLLGSTVWGDDLNGDGYDDAIVNAALWRASSGIGGLSFGGGDGPANRRYNSGEAFVIFGRSGIRGQTVDLATKIDETGRPIDTSITVIYGRNANDLLGEEIAVGDLDGDGQYDLILGTLVGDGPELDMDEAGEAWVIYTGASFAGQMIDLADPPLGQTVVIYPDQPDSKAGDTLRAADLDRDGVDDLFYGAPDYDARGYDGRLRHNAGMMAVIFGEKGGLPNRGGQILLFQPPANLRVKFIVGADDNDMMPYALAIADVNHDGVVDIVPNAMGGDGQRNDRINAGEIYVLDGAEFLSADHVYVVETDTPETAPAPPTAAVATTATPLPSATVAAAVGDLERGQQRFEETCAGCHGFKGEGVPALGLPLVTSPLVLFASDADLLAFLREGRPAGHPDNVTGVSMPPSGGRPDWSDAEFLDIIAYLRWLRDNTDK
ncbi:MAG: cytochrome c [Chloroflexi bacterium]|nr:cytochrome c [Chloroflexota bacterium]